MNKKTVVRVDLKTPPLWNELSNLLGKFLKHFALFGGAIRDTCLDKPIKDYDVRGWVENQEEERRILASLKNAGYDVREVPSAGTGRIRYCFKFSGSEVDLTLTRIPDHCRYPWVPFEAVAIERATAADAGISSVAMDKEGWGYATTDFLFDIANKTITMYPDVSRERLLAYSSRMKDKFPDYQIVWKE